MRPYYQDGAVTIYHGDWREVLPLNADVPAIVTDPPYGMAENTDRTRFSGGDPARHHRHALAPGRAWEAPVVGDDADFDPLPWLAYPEVILWGANHFSMYLPVKGTTLVWIKRHDHAYGTFLSDAEIAWQKGNHGVYCYREVPEATLPKREHPCEKPLGLMRWCIRRVKAPLILDPFAGSGTTLRAAKDLGRKAIGIELEERYCEMAAKRCAQEVLAFDPVAPA